LACNKAIFNQEFDSPIIDAAKDKGLLVELCNPKTMKKFDLHSLDLVEKEWLQQFSLIAQMFASQIPCNHGSFDWMFKNSKIGNPSRRLPFSSLMEHLKEI
jgi:hypothetical protein